MPMLYRCWALQHAAVAPRANRGVVLAAVAEHGNMQLPSCVTFEADCYVLKIQKFTMSHFC